MRNLAPVDSADDVGAPPRIALARRWMTAGEVNVTSTFSFVTVPMGGGSFGRAGTAFESITDGIRCKLAGIYLLTGAAWWRNGGGFERNFYVGNLTLRTENAPARMAGSTLLDVGANTDVRASVYVTQGSSQIYGFSDGETGFSLAYLGPGI